jgi:hypothetical protein
VTTLHLARSAIISHPLLFGNVLLETPFRVTEEDQTEFGVGRSQTGVWERGKALLLGSTISLFCGSLRSLRRIG